MEQYAVACSAGGEKVKINIYYVADYENGNHHVNHECANNSNAFLENASAARIIAIHAAVMKVTAVVTPAHCSTRLSSARRRVCRDS